MCKEEEEDGGLDPFIYICERAGRDSDRTCFPAYGRCGGSEQGGPSAERPWVWQMRISVAGGEQSPTHVVETVREALSEQKHNIRPKAVPFQD